jgi:hypothetical protein
MGLGASAMPGNLKVKNHVFLGKFCTTAEHSACEPGRVSPAITADYKSEQNGACEIAEKNQTSRTEPVECLANDFIAGDLLENRFNRGGPDERLRPTIVGL